MTVSLDFEKIRGNLPGGQRSAFEELVCQLARREHSLPTSFRRIEGAGGDAGVECIHEKAVGRLAGYQAKYYTRASAIDWHAIDDSVKAALATYPELVTYIIAVACDFTGRRRVRGKRIGLGAWGSWDHWVERWTTEAAKAGRTVDFIPWTAYELRARLTPAGADGLRAYWFGETEFSPIWFKRHVELATAALDDRYHPEDHVDVASQELVEFITRHPRSREKLAARFKAVRKESSAVRAFRSESKPSDELLSRAANALDALSDCERELSTPTSQPWDVGKWKRLSHEGLAQVRELLRWTWETTSFAKEHDYTHSRSALQTLSGELRALDQLLNSQYLAAENAHATLLDGRAGTGKSHLLGRMADLAISENRPVVLLLGQQLRDQPLWPQVLQRLELQTASPDQFLATLDAASEVTGQRGLILIDAINEGAGARLWRNELASFLAQVKRHSNLAVVISCRSEYVDYLVPGSTLKALPRHEIHGFESPDERAHAARVFLDRRGISRPATPWLTPEFTNPLFLRSCCVALQREGKTEFPRGLTGTKAILAFFVNSVARHLGVGRDGSDDFIGPTHATLIEIAGGMAKNRHTHLDLESAEHIASTHFRRFQPPNSVTWLEVLQRNGLLRFDPDPSLKPSDPLHGPLHVMRFSFQRFQDHLMADALLGNVHDSAASRGSSAVVARIICPRGVRRECSMAGDRSVHGQNVGVVQSPVSNRSESSLLLARVVCVS